ncbi:palmitoyltransferase akr1, partial [Elasticomyces elasticus]
IAKGITTYENMKRHDHGSNGSSHLPVHNARPTTLGADGGLDSLNDAAASSSRLDPLPRKPDGWFTKLKRTLGIDVFFKTASDASAGKIRDRSNPFSRGPIGNCQDFWFDPAPIFFRRQNGAGYLAGEVVDYNTMYEKPNLLKRRGPLAQRGDMRYEQVATEEDEHE